MEYSKQVFAFRRRKEKYPSLLLLLFFLNSFSVFAQPDAGVSNINSPEAVVSAGTYPVSISVTNNASGAAITSLEIGFRLDNGAATIETWTGSIANNGVGICNFTATFNPTLTGFHMFKAWVKNPNGTNPDRVPGNDTLFYPMIINSAGVPPSAYEGTDFWVGFMDNNNGAAVNLFLFLTASKNSIANVVAPFAGFNQSNIAIPANGIVKVTIPQNSGGIVMDAATSTAVTRVGINITSNNPISVYGNNESTASTDGWTAIPTNNLGKDYIVISNTGASATNPSEFMAIASENATNVTIKLPAGKAAVSKAAGATWSVLLNKGESYIVKSTGGGSDATDLTGTIVTSDKPIVLYGGAGCASYPAGGNRGGYAACPYCDHNVEQMVPTTAWGKNFIMAPFIDPVNNTASKTMKNNGSYIRVVSMKPGTTNYTVSGYAAQTLAGVGNYMDFKMNPDGNIVQSSEPVFVSQILAGDCCYGGVSPLTEAPGDPATMNLVPEEQWGQYYPFATPNPSPGYYRNYINIISKTSNPKIYMDKNKVTNAFVAIPGSSYFYMNLAITEGNHYVISDSPVMIYVYGMTSGAESYAYPASGSTLYSISIPISLLSFNATRAGSSVALKWITASEKNADRFEIERSLDGIRFEKIGSVRASGTSAQTNKYQFTDTKAARMVNYYRLKQVDFDGKINYSDLVNVDLSKLFANLTMQPQPVKDNAQLALYAQENSSIAFAVYDIKGNQALLFDEKAVSEGSNSLSFDFSTLPAGMYFLRITSATGDIESIKFVKN